MYYGRRRASGTVVDCALLECLIEGLPSIGLIIEVPEGKSGVREGSKGLTRPKLIKD